MDKVILPQKILSTQTCTECLNYLSVGPVVVCPEGKIICGRCTKDGIEDVVPSLYNQIAEQCIFKCVNHYSGCKELLVFNEADHEKKCTKANLFCPYCDYEGNGCQLVGHFKTKHSKYVAEENIFKVILETFAAHMIYIEKDRIFCLKFFIIDNVIKIFNLLITPSNPAVKQFKVRFFHADSNIEYITSPIEINEDAKAFLQLEKEFIMSQNSVSRFFPTGECLGKIKFVVDKNFDSEKETLNLRYLKKINGVHGNKPNINKEVRTSNIFERVLIMSNGALKEFVSTELNRLQVCVSCGTHLRKALDVYFCPYHMACPNCTSKKCPKCKSFPLWTQKLNCIRLTLPCEWSGCEENANIFEYLVHKQRCEFRPYKCPDPKCDFIGCLDDFKKHWHMAPYRTGNKVQFSRTEAFYWLIPNVNELVYVTVEKYSWLRMSVSIKVNEETAVLPQAYCFEVITLNKNHEKLYDYKCKWGYLPAQKSRYTMFSHVYSTPVLYARILFKNFPCNAKC